MKPLVIALVLLGHGCVSTAQSMAPAAVGGGRETTPLDSLLVGKWVAIFSFNATGEACREEFEVEYLPNGKARFNRKNIYRKFNKQQARSGNPPLSASQLDKYFPQITWKTEHDRMILTFRSRLGTNDLAYRYQIRGDTLITVSERLSGTRSKLVAVRKSGARPVTVSPAASIPPRGSQPTAIGRPA